MSDEETNSKKYVKQVDGLRYYDNGLHKELLYINKHVVDYNDDYVGLVVGREGAGKSCFSMQLAAALDDNFSLKNVYWDVDKFIKRIYDDEQTPKGTCLVLDEADLVFSNQTMFKEYQKKLIVTLKTCRSRNLKLIFVCPAYFDLKKYVAVHRPTRVYLVDTKMLQRGYWYAWGNKMLSMLWKKGYPYQDLRNKHVKPSLHGKFLGWWPFSEAEYERQKQKELKRLLNDEAAATTPEQLRALVRNSIWFYDELDALKIGKKKEISLKIGVLDNTISNWCKLGTMNKESVPVKESSLTGADSY